MTEKSTAQQEGLPRYTFEVAPGASKREIAHAVETLFNVRVGSVRTANFRGKVRRGRSGLTPGRTRSWKKAVVTLAPGETLELIETP